MPIKKNYFLSLRENVEYSQSKHKSLIYNRHNTTQNYYLGVALLHRAIFVYTSQVYKRYVITYK